MYVELRTPLKIPLPIAAEVYFFWLITYLNLHKSFKTDFDCCLLFLKRQLLNRTIIDRIDHFSGHLEIFFLYFLKCWAMKNPPRKLFWYQMNTEQSRAHNLKHSFSYKFVYIHTLFYYWGNECKWMQINENEQKLIKMYKMKVSSLAVRAWNLKLIFMYLFKFLIENFEWFLTHPDTPGDEFTKQRNNNIIPSKFNWSIFSDSRIFFHFLFGSVVLLFCKSDPWIWNLAKDNRNICFEFQALMG